MIARLDGVASVSVKDKEGETTITMKEGKSLTEKQVKDAMLPYKGRVFGVKNFKAVEAKKATPASSEPKKDDRKETTSK